MNDNIQGLRALAAYAVVAHHLLDSLLNNYIAHMHLSLQAGATGVDVFFVISGYIMASTSSARAQSPSLFALNRIVRIVPIYWILTLALAGVMAGHWHMFGQSLSLVHLFKSLFFIATPGGMPLLFVGWTLNYEMAFYALFSLCLFIRPIQLRLYVLCAVIAAVWMIGLFFPAGSYINYMSNSIILEFALGVLLWIVSRKWTPSAPLAMALGLLGLAGLFVPDLLTLPSKTLATAPAACALVMAAVALEAKGLSIGDGWLKRQGDASYSIYLTHPFVIQLVGKAAIATHLAGSTAGLSATLALMIGGVILVGTAFHRAVEKPLTAWLKTAFRGSPRFVDATA